MVCCAVIFSGCSKKQQTTYYTTTTYEFANSDNAVAVKAILGTIDNYWDGEYTFNGDDIITTDMHAGAKYLKSAAAILFHQDDIISYFNENDCFYYNLYRSGDNELLGSQKYYRDGNDINVEVIKEIEVE